MFQMISRILGLSGTYKKHLIFSFVMTFLESSMAGMAVFVLYFAITDSLTLSLTTDKIVQYSIILVAALLFRYIFKLLECIFQSGVGYKIVCGERIKLGEKLIKLSMSYFSKNDPGHISSVVNNDLIVVEGLGIRYLSQLVSSMASASIMLIVIAIIDYRVALTACLGLPIPLYINYILQKRFVKQAAIRQRTHGKAISIMLEYIKGIFVIKNYQTADLQKSRLYDVLGELEDMSINFEKKLVPVFSMYLSSFQVASVVLLAVVAFMMTSGTMALSSALLFAVLIFTIYGPMDMIGLASGFLRVLNACLDRLEGIMNTPMTEPDVSVDNIPKPKDMSIVFNNVHFSYDDKKVLDGVSFSAPPNTLTAFVGPSGCGKSTILNLIARFYQVKEGTICLGDVDIKKLPHPMLMSYMSIVFQNAYLFHDTVYENIRFGNTDATREMIVQAAKKAFCHDFITDKENGYDTIIGEGGSTLSGGEKQRIAIARAILKDTPIIILDEVTSSIDPKNEKFINLALEELIKNRTVFVVSHKLASIQNADQIVVINEKGRVDAIGTHDVLILESTLYRNLCDKSQKISRWGIE